MPREDLAICRECAAEAFIIRRVGNEFELQCFRGHRVRPLAYVYPPPVPPAPVRTEHSVYSR